MPPKTTRPPSGTFALALLMHRERLRITQAQAAMICGVSPRIWSKWENGGSTLAVTQEGAIARLEKK